MKRRQFLGGVIALGGALCAAGCGSSTNSGFATASLAAPPSNQALDAALDQAFAQLRFSSVIAAVEGPQLSWRGKRGSAPQSNPFTRIGSITKTVTATAILQLVDQKQLQLDDTIERWFPQLPDAGAITVRMLGTMNSGIPSYTADGHTVDTYLANPGRFWTPAELMAISFSMDRVFLPGQGFNYSNTNFLMLAQIVEQLSGQPIDQFFRQRIFTPLALNDTSYPRSTDLPDPYWTGLTLQGSSNGQPLDASHWSPTFAGAAGELVSNLDNVIRWAQAVGEGVLLTPSTQQERLQPNPYASSPDGRSYLFGLGNDNGWLAHSGEIPGYNSQFAYQPERRLTIVVLANSDIESLQGGAPAVEVFKALRAVL